MPEHLNKESISVLLDRPEGVPGGLEHLTECPECAREYEQMSRMRMALSGLPDVEPPAGEWTAIQERLGLEPVPQPSATPMSGRRMAWLLQAAAVIALFAAGLMVGQRIDGGANGQQEPSAVASTTEATRGPGSADASADPESLLAAEPADSYLRTVADLQELRDGFGPAHSAAPGPEAVAERITHLDAMIDASRDALREAPADPVLNNFLFQMVDERNDLAGQLDQTLRMTAAEY